MDVSQRRLLDVLATSNTRFVIPLYQRAYSWGHDQCEELWLDILRAARYERNHFCGTVLYLEVTKNEAPTKGGIKLLEIVDGQQRIITTSLLILALARFLDEKGVKCNGRDGEALRRELLTIEVCEEREIKLLPSQTDRALYHNIVLGDFPSGDRCASDELMAEVAATAGSTSRILANMSFFAEKIEEDGFDPDELMRGLERLHVIMAKVDDARAAQSIFESINSKGMPLNVADMVRNYLLLSEERAEQARMYREYWQAIQGMFAPDPGSLRLDTAIKSWLSIRLKGARIRSPEQVYSSFKRFVEDRYRGEKEPILRELRGFSLMWAESYRYHGAKKYKSGSDWAELGAPALTSGYKLKKPDNEEYAARIREELRAVDERW